MTLELAAVIAIGACLLVVVLLLVESVRWRGAAARPAPGSRGRAIGWLSDRIRDSILAWLLGGLVRRVASIRWRSRRLPDASVLMAHRQEEGSATSRRPAATRPTRIVVAGERQPFLAPVASTTPTLARPLRTALRSADQTSPRRRLWRDATAVLVVLGVLAIALYVGGQQPQGGVLGATATPLPPAGQGLAGSSLTTNVAGSMRPTAPGQTPRPTTNMASPPAATIPPTPPPARSAAPAAATTPASPAPTGRPSPTPTPGPTAVTPVATLIAPRTPAPSATVAPQPPVARFLATPTSGGAPLIVRFGDASTGTVDRWAWDFGDGGTSSARNPVHTFTAPGTYGVTLTVTGSGGSDSYAVSVVVSVASPSP